jgi:hypothetical protein
MRFTMSQAPPHITACAQSGFAPQHVELVSKDKDLGLHAARDRNSSIKAQQINLQRSLIGSEYQPICGRGEPFWVCGKDRGKRHPIHILEAGSACLNVRCTRLEFQSDKSPMLGLLGKTGFGMR